MDEIRGFAEYPHFLNYSESSTTGVQMQSFVYHMTQNFVNAFMNMYTYCVETFGYCH